MPISDAWACPDCGSSGVVQEGRIGEPGCRMVCEHCGRGVAGDAMSDEVAVGDVVQIDPKAGGEVFGRAFLIVDKVKPWGFQGRVFIAGRGDAHYRVQREYAYRVGTAKWRRPI